MRTAVWSTHWRVAIDVSQPPDDAIVDLNCLHALGDIGLNDVHAKESRSVHSGPAEDVLGNVLAVARSSCPLDHQTEQHVADVAVAAALTGCEVGWLTDKL